MKSTDDRCGPIGNPPRPLAQARENRKLNARSPSILNSQKTNLPLSVSNSTGEDGQGGVRVAAVGIESINGNTG